MKTVVVAIFTYLSPEGPVPIVQLNDLEVCMYMVEKAMVKAVCLIAEVPAGNPS